MTDRSILRLPTPGGGDPVGIPTTTDLVHYIPRLRRETLRRRTAPIAPS